MSIKMTAAQIGYDLLSSDESNKVIAIDRQTVAKLFVNNEVQALEELRLLKLANSVNSLLVVAIEVRNTDNQCDLIMERLYPLEVRAISKSEQVRYAAKFIEQLNELHVAGLAHGSIKRSSKRNGSPWDNICITPSGFRLINVAASVTKASKDFEDVCQSDIKSAQEYIRSYS